jgi:hypothetical protein
VTGPADGVLCSTCGTRLRVLLSARAGVRRPVEGPPLWPASIGLGLALLVIAVVVRQFGGVPSEPARSTSGVWQILGGAGFVSPVGLAADTQGNLYVADAASYHIYKLSAEGTLLAILGTQGTAPGQLERPSAIALDAAGNLYVADSANNRIEKLSPTGTPLGSWGAPGGGPGQFKGPRGVAVDHEGNVYVGDTGNDRDHKL